MESKTIKTLILIDVQTDFFPGGALAIPRADKILPNINGLMAQFDCVVATLDWHPSEHVSFAATHQKKVGDKIWLGNSEQILWPVHCVQNTTGADFVSGLHRDRIEAVFHKGSLPKVDSYSAFFDTERNHSTGLASYLHEKKSLDLYFVGVATDYCILYSVLDALDLGFRVTVIPDACRAVNIQLGDEEKAIGQMEDKGASILFAEEWL